MLGGMYIQANSDLHKKYLELKRAVMTLDVLLWTLTETYLEIHSYLNRLFTMRKVPLARSCNLLNIEPPTICILSV